MTMPDLLARADPKDLVGYAAALSVFASFCMSTMAPLRAVALLSNLLFITYGYLDGLYPVLVLHLALLPVNTWRIIQVIRLIGSTECDVKGFDISALRPHMTQRRLPAGKILFRRGDEAHEMFYLERGEVEIEQSGGLIRGPGTIIGEMGVLSRIRRRTATVVARTDCLLLGLTAARMRALYFQHPAFTLHLLETLADRLIPDAGPQPAPPIRPEADQA